MGRIGRALPAHVPGDEGLEIALSGGKDSALTLIIAWLYAQRRFGHLEESAKTEAMRNFINCYSLPTRHNSEMTKGIARLLCEELGVSFTEISIEEEYNLRVRKVQQLIGAGREVPRVTRQNIQARIRGSLMWDLANAFGYLWIQTGNMSEKAVGYTTIGGDMMGGYSLIGNLPKTVVIELLGYLHQRYRWKALGELLMTEASAELEENQADEKDLMPFPVLDACFALFVGEKLMPAQLYKAVRDMWTDDELQGMREDYVPGMLKEWVKKFVRLFVGSIFKWVQAPQAVHLERVDLDRERATQLPVVQSREWLELDEIDNFPD
jgi:NAD+ synthase (glutamine-hydrolysing)